MRVATWNVNSIRARLPRVLAFLERRQPDVVCLQETKVEDAGFPLAELLAAGYQAVTAGQRTYNGVAILGRAPIAAVSRAMGGAAPEREARLIAGTCGGLRVVSVYVPNGQDVDSEKYAAKLAWLSRLQAFLEQECDPTQPLVMCGDYNVAPEPIDVHEPARWEGSVLFNPELRQVFQRLLGWGLIDAFRHLHPEERRYSWWDYRQLAFPKNHGLRIDHVLLTARLAARCRAAEIDRDERKGPAPSDHVPVVVDLDL